MMKKKNKKDNDNDDGDGERRKTIGMEGRKGRKKVDGHLI